NGHEFVNDNDKTSKDSAFEKAVAALGMELRRTRPYSPWQNGKVERSHREDGKILYGRKVFTSEKELRRQVSKHEARYNKTAKTVLNFKSPNQIVEEYFSKCNTCLDS
ncbi:MAG: integrase core domain-containing protein, partial [Eubacteriales bacterium]|nr:integrase core domain-containing protein [Eubacteriales bacterium]